MASSVLSAASHSLSASSSLSSRQIHKVPLSHCSHIGFDDYPFCDLTFLSNRGNPRLETTLWDLTMESTPSQMQGYLLKMKAYCFNCIHLFWFFFGWFIFISLLLYDQLGGTIGKPSWFLHVISLMVCRVSMSVNWRKIELVLHRDTWMDSNETF